MIISCETSIEESGSKSHKDVGDTSGNKGAIKVSFLNVSAEYDGQRCDNFLLRELKGVPKSHIYKILRRGWVRINGKRVKPEQRLVNGDIIKMPQLRCAASTFNSVSGSSNPTAQLHYQRMLLQKIIYEDNSLIVLHKPSGMAVHGGSGINFGVIETMRQARPDLRYLELVHRLDRDTSGCILLAKKRSMLRVLHELLREGQVHKTYLLLVKGKWRGGNKEVDVALKKNQLAGGERIVQVNDAGKRAVTIFRPQRTFELQLEPNSNQQTAQKFGDAEPKIVHLSMLEADLLTGRTHQIRVHAAHLGFHLAGDDKYGDAEFNKFMRGFGLRRLFLHAAAIEFCLPDTQTKMRFTAPLPVDLVSVLQRLESSQQRK